jgi:ribosome biogenesis protein Tsr3
MALAEEKGEDCHDYAGCSLSLLRAPANSCNYATCYGKDNDVECGTHKLHRLKDLQKGSVRKKSKAHEPLEVVAEPLEETAFEEDDSMIEEEDGILEEMVS